MWNNDDCQIEQVNLHVNFLNVRTDVNFKDKHNVSNNKRNNGEYEWVYK